MKFSVALEVYHLLKIMPVFLDVIMRSVVDVPRLQRNVLPTSMGACKGQGKPGICPPSIRFFEMEIKI
jgi:hypothetical protein